MSANDIQVGGDHYKGSAMEPWDFIENYGLGYMEGNIVKYVSRWRKKGGVEDLKKVKHYVIKLEELALDGRKPRATPPGPGALSRYFEANAIEDFREMILISMFSADWTEMTFNHAQLLLDSLILSGVDGVQA